uniref:Uncharacterized protein n=1 Tax=Anguilla anguilla TaxID=7936 RepID=A0A0E9WRG0_ANGAN
MGIYKKYFITSWVWEECNVDVMLSLTHDWVIGSMSQGWLLSRWLVTSQWGSVANYQQNKVLKTLLEPAVRTVSRHWFHLTLVLFLPCMRFLC